VKKKILVADDDPSIVHLLENILGPQGYQVLSAQNGSDALALAKRESPDLVILDVMMPGVNGYDVCFALKFDKAYKHIPIILLTVRPKELNDEIGAKAGIEYIHKPTDTVVLLKMIERMLGP